MISVYYPRGYKTGGPQALHQLVDACRKQGIDAQLVPMPGTEHNLDVPEYARYDCPISLTPARGHVVVPEIAPELLMPKGCLQTPEDGKNYIWWLSLDNVRTHTMPYANHLTQSYYARNALRERGIKTQMLTDYTHVEDFPEGGTDRARMIAYNPAKGGEHVESVKRLMPEVEWVPLENMNKEQIGGTLRTASVYLDLGHHPGKDRMPREAALSGAAVMVANRGSAAVFLDVMAAWKVDQDKPEEVMRKLQLLLDNPVKAVKAQENYVAKIKGEKQQFFNEVKEVFGD